MDGLPLDQVEIRVLGALIEKELTTPAYYPLSVNALTNACNQINNREPVVSYTEGQVSKALDSLRDKRLAYVFSGADSRVLKFGHKLADAANLRRPETALLCVLFLRGPQTVGELRGRTGRMHEFADLNDVEAILNELAARPEPLVVRLERQPGARESRYAHLLAGEVFAAAPAAAPSVSPGTAAAAQEIAVGQPDRVAALEAEVALLKQDLAELRAQFAEFKRQFE